jgi:ABC-2 type transport system ATP-binding protein
MNPNPGLNLRAVTKSFGRRQALRGADFSCSSGITAVLGPNGAGKSTLLRVMATAQSPDSGQVSILGYDAMRAEDRVEIRRRLGYFPQEPGSPTGMTVFQFVDYVAILKEMTSRRERHQEVQRVIDLVGLSDRSGSRVRALSGGMKRRMFIAQALLGSPELLVLDEPTAGLDPEQRLRFRELVSDDTSRTVVLSTHQTEDVAALCQNVVVLLKGRNVFAGTVAELAATAEGRVWKEEQRSPGALLAWRAADGSLRNIGDPPSGAELVEPTLEDAYLLMARPPEAHEAVA